MFAIVEFLEEHSVSVVCESWLQEGSNNCFYPRVLKNVKKYLLQGRVPDEKFKRYRIKLLCGNIENYELALEKEKERSEKGDTSAQEETHRMNLKARQHPLEKHVEQGDTDLNKYFESESVNRTQSKNQPKNGNLSKNFVPSTSKNAVPTTSRSKSATKNATKPNGHQPLDESEDETETLSGNRSSSNSDKSSESEAEIRNNTNKSSTIVNADVQNIKDMLNILINKQKETSKDVIEIKVTQNALLEAIAEIKLLLPNKNYIVNPSFIAAKNLSSIQQLDETDKKLGSDIVYAQSMIGAYLPTTCRGHAKKEVNGKVKSILVTLINQQTLLKFGWTAHKDLATFQKYANIINWMLDVINASNNAHLTNIEQVRVAVHDFFRRIHEKKIIIKSHGDESEKLN